MQAPLTMIAGAQPDLGLSRLPTAALIGLLRAPQPNVPMEAVLVELQRRRAGGTNIDIAGLQRPAELPIGPEAVMARASGMPVAPAPMPPLALMGDYSAGGMGIGGIPLRPRELPVSPALEAIQQGSMAAEGTAQRFGGDLMLDPAVAAIEHGGGESSRGAGVRQLAEEIRGTINPQFDAMMAIAKAGFGTAVGKSPYAIQNTSQGALFGLEDYQRSRDRNLAARIRAGQLDLQQDELDARREATLAKATQPEIVHTYRGGVYRVPRVSGAPETLVEPQPAREPLGSESLQLMRELENPDLSPQMRTQIESRLRHLQGSDRGGPTQSQAALNEQIDEARSALAEMNLKPDQIRNAAVRFLPDGRPNPTYDPFISRYSRLAQRRKIGVVDEGFKPAWRMITGTNAPDDEGSELGLEPGFLGGDRAPAKSQPAPDQPQQRRGAVGRAMDWVGRQISGGNSIPRTAEGGIDASQLRVGDVYDAPGGRKARWNGQGFSFIE